MSLYPLITKPSRITVKSETAIDHIFTNYMQNNLNYGLLITDVSDHLPVFVIYNCECKRENKENTIKYKRLRTDETMNAFKGDLLNHSWELLYKEKNVDKAYEYFLNVFKSLYDKNCPLRKYSVKFTSLTRHIQALDHKRTDKCL